MNQNSTPLVSIIIPCREIDDYTKECIKRCRQLDYKNYEIILLPDNENGEMTDVKTIPTGSVTPGVKRNTGVANSRGKVCAFIDSDAYPRRDWLINALNYFDDPQVAAVGGPGLTPEGDSPMQRAGGHVLSSFMVGSLSTRYKSKQSFKSDDIHSCNFIVRKKVLEQVGGWNLKYWPGEDTLISLAIRNLGKQLIEASDVVVYHHRRPLLIPHLKQISRFGLHRGFFVKRFKGNSLKLTYLFPSFLVLFLFVSGVVAYINSFFVGILPMALAAYFISCLAATLQEVKRSKLIPAVWLGIIATHVVYGFSFLIGFVKRDLQK